MRPSLWHADPAELLRAEAEARGVTREELIRAVAERYRRVLDGLGVEETTEAREV